MVDKTDAAFSYVTAANRKAAAHQARRTQQRAPSAKLNLAVMVLLLAVAARHYQDDRTGAALLFAGLALFNGCTAYRLLCKKAQP